MKLIFDEHFPDELAAAIRRERAGVNATSIHARNLDGLDDSPLLALLDRQKTVLVTRDVTTIRPELNDRLAAGLTHGGVIFVPKSIPQTDDRMLLRRLLKKLDEAEGADWTCRVEWL